MTTKNPIISHPGIVDEISGNSITVKILSQSACASCHAKSMCSISEMEEKMVEVRKPEGKNFKIGDSVTVYMEKSQGNRAVFYAYFLPFLLVLVVLLIMLQVSKNEGLVGLIALGVLIPYYFVLYKYRDKMKKSYIFRVY